MNVGGVLKWVAVSKALAAGDPIDSLVHRIVVGHVLVRQHGRDWITSVGQSRVKVD